MQQRHHPLLKQEEGDGAYLKGAKARDPDRSITALHMIAQVRIHGLRLNCLVLAPGQIRSNIVAAQTGLSRRNLADHLLCLGLGQNLCVAEVVEVDGPAPTLPISDAEWNWSVGAELLGPGKPRLLGPDRVGKLAQGAGTVPMLHDGCGTRETPGEYRGTHIDLDSRSAAEARPVYLPLKGEDGLRR